MVQNKEPPFLENAFSLQKRGDFIDSFITREYVTADFEKPFFSREQNEIKSIIGWENA